MTTEKVSKRTENSQIVEVDTSQFLDALLHRAPQRTAELAAPPGNSDLLPILGDRGIPFIGCGIHILRYGPAFQLQLLRRHGPVSWCQAFGQKVVLVSGPDAVQEVLTNKDKAFATGWPPLIGPWFDGGLLAMDSPDHLIDRRLMQSAFDTQAVAGYVRLMAESTRAALSRWPLERRFSAVAAIRELSGQISTGALLGVPYDPAGRRIMRAVESCIRAETAALRLRIPGTTWDKAHRARRWLLQLLTETVPSARQRDGDDFLSVLSRSFAPDADRFTAERIAQQTLFTLIASHDTTVAAMIATFYFLGKHPEWQERARAESLASVSAPADVTELNQLSALDIVIKESIRLVSPSPINMRVAVRDTAVDGHFIPAGQLISVCTAVNQILPELWDEPHQFDPERFLAPRSEDRSHRLAWAPFGSGAHKCIGMYFGTLKVKAVIDAFLRSFEWSFPTDYEAQWRFTSLPAPADGLPATLSPLRT